MKLFAAFLLLVMASSGLLAAFGGEGQEGTGFGKEGGGGGILAAGGGGGGCTQGTLDYSTNCETVFHMGMMQ